MFQFGGLLEVRWPGNSDMSVNNFVKHYKSSIGPLLL